MQIKSQHLPERLKGVCLGAFPTSESLTWLMGSFVRWELPGISKTVSCILFLPSGSP